MSITRLSEQELKKGKIKTNHSCVAGAPPEYTLFLPRFNVHRIQVAGDVDYGLSRYQPVRSLKITRSFVAVEA